MRLFSQRADLYEAAGLINAGLSGAEGLIKESEEELKDLALESEEEESEEEESESEEEESESESEENRDDSNYSVSDSEVVDRYTPRHFKPETYPPEWKSIEESPQYNYGLITRFVPVWRDIPHEKLGYEFKKFLSQIVESRGYDFDGNTPHNVKHPFTLNDFVNDPIYRKRPKVFPRIMDFVVTSINKDALPHNEKYAMHKLEKVVLAWPHWMMLLTFSVKAVAIDNEDVEVNEALKTIQAMVFFAPGYYRMMEWRFKPEASYTETSDATSMEF